MTDLTEEEMADPWKGCVPKDARNAVLEENHSQPTAGHQGIAKTIARVSRRYYWRGMFRNTARLSVIALYVSDLKGIRRNLLERCNHSVTVNRGKPSPLT